MFVTYYIERRIDPRATEPPVQKERDAAQDHEHTEYDEAVHV
jgi:hypothetical protein